MLKKPKIKKSLRQVLQLHLDCRTVQETINDLLIAVVKPNYMHSIQITCVIVIIDCCRSDEITYFNS